MPDEAGQILGLYHTAADELGAADDALQRGLELVGDVCRKLAAAALGVLLIRHVEGKEHRADRLTAGLDAAEIELIGAPAALAAHLAVAVFHGVGDGAAHVAAAVDGQEVLPHARAAHAVEPLRRRVDTQHDARVVEQDEPLLHAAGDLVELVRLAAQRAQLRGDLAVLLVDAPEQRRQLLIAADVQRVVEVEPVERVDDPLREPPGENAREDQCRGQHQQHRLQHAEDQQTRRRAADGDAQHRPVAQPPGIVERLLQERRGVAGALALSGLERLLHLLAIGVALHRGRVRLRIIEDAAVGGDPRQAEAVGRELREVVPARALHRSGGQRQLVLELRLLHAAEEIIQIAENQQKAREQDRPRHEHNGAENLSCHACTSHR